MNSDPGVKRKPTRRQLLQAISDLQCMVGQMHGIYYNDRAGNTADRLEPLFKNAFNLCVEMTSADDPASYERKP